MNGPISCYYIAVVPLPSNVSLESLPDPHDTIVDSCARVSNLFFISRTHKISAARGIWNRARQIEKAPSCRDFTGAAARYLVFSQEWAPFQAFQNNLMQGEKERKVYFAYIAESYKQLPPETVIGDGEPVPGASLCNVQYLSRHKSEDRMLRPGMKYTGFLIVRVDRTNPYGAPVKEETTRTLTPRRYARAFEDDGEFDRERYLIEQFWLEKHPYNLGRREK